MYAVKFHVVIGKTLKIILHIKSIPYIMNIY
jgi:hypothetical protein